MSSNQDSPALAFDNVTKYYGDTLALENLSLQVHSGDFLGLLGPNGAGKSTAIHLATGLAKLQQGKITVFGYDVIDDYEQARRCIGLAPQEPNFDRFFSVMDCLEYQGGYFSMDPSTSRERALELLELFELEEKKDARPHHLSGGQKRRLLLAKSLIHDPELVILDEPTAGLDVELRQKLWKFLDRLKERGKTLLLTTHYIEEVEALADRVAVLNQGELILDDSIDQVLERFGRFQCVFDVDTVPEPLVHSLPEKFPFVTVENSTLRANRREFNSEIAELLNTLQSHDVEIHGMRFEETPLEEIFLDQVNASNNPRQSSP